MLKFSILLVLGLIVVGNCRSSETRKRLRIDGNEDEHVHIKVVLKPKLPPRHSTRPQNVATLRQSAASSQNIQDQQFELPAPMPIFTTQHDILAHIAAATVADNNDVGRHNHSTRTQPKHKKQQQQQRKQHKRAPVIMLPPPPPPAPLSSPFMATPDIFSSTVLDGNVLTADDFLREVQHLYAQNYGGANGGGATPTLIMQPQMQALTKTTTTTSTSTTTTRPTSTKMAKNNDKKRKHNQSDYNYNYNHFPYGKQTYLQQQQQQQPQLLQQSQQQSQLQQGFKPYMSNQAHGNYYYYDDYNRNNHHFFDINNNNYKKKKTKLNMMENLAMGANQLRTHQIADDIDANSSINSDGSSTEDYSADSGSDTVMAFNAPIHPEEPSVATIYASASSPSFSQNNNNNYYYNSQLSSNGKTVGDNNDDDNDDDGIGHDDNNDDDNDESFNPISYQDLYATYSATPAAQHFSTMPTMTTTGLKYKRHNQHFHQPHQQQQQQYQQQKGLPLREQFVQLSSIAPAAASSGINAFRIAPASSLTLPTTATSSTTTTLNSGGFNIYGDAQQPLEARHRKRKNHIKVKRNRLMVH